MSPQEEETAFEADVRRIAGILWPQRVAPHPTVVLGRERDGVFETGDVVHVVEATVSRKVEKVERDLRKSIELVRDGRKTDPTKNFKIWIVTREDPTGDQVALVASAKAKAKCPVEMLSHKHFAGRIIDAREYLQRRGNYPFGSIRNPDNEKDFRVPRSDYISVALINAADRTEVDGSSIPDLVRSDTRRTVVLLGDYGSGKSMTMRSVFYALEDAYVTNSDPRFPIYINLRDHFGQDDPAEALMRHGTRIGFSGPSQLVAAWNAGLCHVLLDGYDEVSSSRMVRESQRLRAARRQAVQLVRNFLESTSQDSAKLLSGREHYFDSDRELTAALGLDEQDVLLHVEEFTIKQIKEYLRKRNRSDIDVPDWIPSRPLLLAYLAGKTQHSDLSLAGREEGWDFLLDRVCEREAKQINPSVDPKQVRQFIERLATGVRSTTSGRGPIYAKDIDEVFQEIFEVRPDEKSEILISRLPGLTTSKDDAREFVDGDFVDACRAGDVVRFVDHPHDEHIAEIEITNQMGDLGCRLAAHKLTGSSAGKLSAALRKSTEQETLSGLSIDLVGLFQELQLDYTGTPAYVRNGMFSDVVIVDGGDLSGICLESCFIGRAVVEGHNARGPRFVHCDVESIVGPQGPGDLPVGIFDSSTVVHAFLNEAQTNADIMGLSISLGRRVLLTVLRKLFVQSGSGRRESAFFPGFDHRARSYVDGILRLVEQHHFARPYKVNGPRVWIPNRAKAGEAWEILKAPKQSNHPLVAAVEVL